MKVHNSVYARTSKAKERGDEVQDDSAHESGTSKAQKLNCVATAKPRLEPSPII
nr:MAG TPA: hypothetical protein [Bacteriophage sp.]